MEERYYKALLTSNVPSWCEASGSNCLVCSTFSPAFASAGRETTPGWWKILHNVVSHNQGFNHLTLLYGPKIKCSGLVVEQLNRQIKFRQISVQKYLKLSWHNTSISLKTSSIRLWSNLSYLTPTNISGHTVYVYGNVTSSGTLSAMVL